MSDIQISSSSNGLADVPGFRTGAIGCDIRKKGNDRLDLSLLVSDSDAVAAGVFTTNAIQAAPVRLSHAVLSRQKTVRALVANSGNANACTGKQGMRDALDMQSVAAQALGVPVDSVLVASTGRIGEYLPMERIREGIRNLAPSLGDAPEHGLAAADAILTSDTGRKTATIKLHLAGQGTITLAGIAKGAGMIQPNMATMLAFLATDAKVDREFLVESLGLAVRDTFNAVTVDGDTSTNDTVFVLANGASGVEIDPKNAEVAGLFQDALRELCGILARKIVGDGEKITRVVEILIESAASAEDAERVARSIGNSLLVKTSWFGGDPNWGRLLDAAGYSGARMREEEIELFYRRSKGEDPVPVFIRGEAQPENKPAWKEIVAHKHFSIIFRLNQGTGAFRLLASDLTDGYVNFNRSE